MYTHVPKNLHTFLTDIVLLELPFLLTQLTFHNSEACLEKEK